MREAAMRSVACLTMCLIPMLANAAQSDAHAPSDPQAYCVIAALTFTRIRGSPAKAAINSDRAIAEELTGALLPCKERSVSHRPVRRQICLRRHHSARPLTLTDDRTNEHVTHSSGSKARVCSFLVPWELDAAILSLHRVSSGNFCSADQRNPRSAVALLLGACHLHAILPFGDGHRMAVAAPTSTFRLNHRIRRARLLDHNIRTAGRTHARAEIGLRNPNGAWISPLGRQANDTQHGLDGRRCKHPGSHGKPPRLCFNLRRRDNEGLNSMVPRLPRQ